ncbi:MAG: phosphatase PAP2 family protein [Planctomycetota bacterium]|nr:phosphatase PAP2 family protein [Planctomycetota bacterium]
MAIKPYVLITYFYQAAISSLILVFAPGIAWPYLVLAVGAGGVLMALERVLRHRSEIIGAAARLGYFAVFLPTSYLQLKTIIPAVHPRRLDATLRAIDGMIFGVDPTIAIQHLTHPLATEILQIAYMTYYLLPLVLPILLLRKRRILETEEFAFALLFCYYITFLGYIAVPAIGPVVMIDHEVELTGLFLGGHLYDLILRVDAHRFDCFPSGHTAVAILVVAYAWKLGLRRVAGFLTVDATLIIAATVYMRYHYVIDLPAGAAVAVGSYLLARRVYRSGRPEVGRSPS